MKKKEWLILGIISIVAGLALGCTNLLTSGRIAEQANAQANAARIAVMPDTSEFVELEVPEGSKLDNLYLAKKGDEEIGCVGQATTTGFGGPIAVVLGVDSKGVVTGISVGGSDFAETAGLGTRVREPGFTDQFVGLTSTPALNDNVDGISGSTVSSYATTYGAKLVYQAAMAQLTGAEIPTEEAALTITVEDRRTATAKGFGGDIQVSVGVNADGTIEAIEISPDGFNETSGLGARAMEPAFLNQFAGKTGPLSYGDGLDAISGATITSDAVLKAVNEALGFGEEAPAPTAAPEITGDVTVVEKVVQGFGGEIVVSVGVDEAGKIASLEVGGPNFNETAGLGARAQEADFTNQFIGKSGALSYGDGLDAISGATITSEAVLKAVNAALGTSDEGNAAVEVTAAPVEEMTATEAPKATEEPKATEAPTAAPEAKTVAAKNLTEIVQTVQGFGGEIEVTVGIDTEGKIASLAVGGPKFAETAGLGARAQEAEFTDQFIGKSGELAYGDGLDAISGATITSTAVLDAVNAALKK